MFLGNFRKRAQTRKVLLHNLHTASSKSAKLNLLNEMCVDWSGFRLQLHHPLWSTQAFVCVIKRMQEESPLTGNNQHKPHDYWVDLSCTVSSTSFVLGSRISFVQTQPPLLLLALAFSGHFHKDLSPHSRTMRKQSVNPFVFTKQQSCDSQSGRWFLSVHRDSALLSKLGKALSSL